MHGGEQVVPGVLPGPAFGQVQVDGAGAVGQAGGDVDAGADGGGAGGSVAACGQVPGGAGEVVGDAGAGQPGAVGAEVPGGQVGQGSVDEVGVDLFAALDPLSPDRCTPAATIPRRPADSASRITDSRPAHDTRFGSSNVACATGAPYRNLTS